MPEISRFYGIVIRMFYNEHNPPHIYIQYAEWRAVFSLDGELTAGALPRRAEAMVVEWIVLRRHDLERNWLLATQNEPLLPVEPLA